MAVERIEAKPKADPIAAAYEAEYGAWRSRVDVLVTSLCMGRSGAGISIYAFEVSALPPDPSDEPETRIARDGSTYRVIPARHRYSEERREQIGAKADAARLELAGQVGVAPERWPVVATAVMASPRLLGWLQSQRLIPRKPERGRPKKTAEQREDAANRLAMELVP